jgi:membrane protein implicated in regulation of membrane protease activity
VAQGRFVDVNTRVKVIHVEGNRVVVEPLEAAAAEKTGG